MSLEENEISTHRIYDELWNERKPEVASTPVSKDGLDYPRSWIYP